MNPEKFSCIRTVDKTVKIPLWDMYTTTEYKGIEAALDKWKRQYEKQVGGIVVSYKNVSIPSRLGFHSDRGSYAIYNVRATFDVFCPKVGEIVKGKINRVSSEHIGCLIAETINVSIRLPRDSPSGLSKYIYLDREILFEIRSFSCKPRALCVNGEVTAKCVELMDEFYPVADEFSYEPTSQAVFGDVPSDAEDLQVNLSILGTDGKKKKGKKRGREETEEEENATDSPRVKKIKKDLNLPNSQEEEASSSDTPKKGKKKVSMDSPKPKKSKKGLISTNSPGMAQVYGDTSSTDTPKKGKKHKMNSPKPKKSLISANGPEMMGEGGETSSTDTLKKLKKEGSMDSPTVKQIQWLQEESSFIDTPKKAKKKKSSLTDSPKVSQEDSSSTESAKKIAAKSTDSSQESQSSSTESDKKEKKKLSNKKAKKKASKSTESPMKIKKELLSSTEDEGSKKKSKKKPKKKSKDSAKPKDKKKSSKKKGKVTASGDILKKDKKKSKKSSKKDDKSKKKSKKDKSEKKKKTKLSNDGDVTLKEIKSEGL